MPLAWKIIFEFLREIILGKTTLKQAFRDHKLRLAFLVLVIVSFYLNYLTLPKLYQLTEQRVQIEESYKEQINKLEHQVTECRTPETVSLYPNGFIEWCWNELQKRSPYINNPPPKLK